MFLAYTKNHETGVTNPLLQQDDYDPVQIRQYVKAVYSADITLPEDLGREMWTSIGFQIPNGMILMLCVTPLGNMDADNDGYDDSEYVSDSIVIHEDGSASKQPVFRSPTQDPSYSNFVKNQRSMLVSKIKAEAQRRIYDVCPEWKQRNLTAQATILSEKGRENWTQEENDAWFAGEWIWEQIANIRAKSNDLEAMDRIPDDFSDDKWWP